MISFHGGPREEIETGVSILPGVSPNIINILDSNFFTYLNYAWQQIHPRELECRRTYHLRAPYRTWEPSADLIQYVHGHCPSWAQPWHKVPDIVIVCLCAAHWAVCRVRLRDWEIQLYDPLLYRMDDPTDLETYFHRE